jgi:hypothetical protein
MRVRKQAHTHTHTHTHRTAFLCGLFYDAANQYLHYVESTHIFKYCIIYQKTIIIIACPYLLARSYCKQKCVYGNLNLVTLSFNTFQNVFEVPSKM